MTAASTAELTHKDSHPSPTAGLSENSTNTSATTELSTQSAAPAQHEDTLFHSEAWRTAVEEAFGLDIAAFSPASEAGGSAFYSLVDDIRGRRLVSTPFSDFCEPHLSTEAGWTEYTSHLRSYECPITLRPFANPIALQDDSFEHRGGLLWHGIDLTDGASGLFDRLKSRVRTKIRRVPKQGVTFRASSSKADIAAMHAMHVQLRKAKYGLLAQPKRFFDVLSDNFADDMVVVFAELDGEPIAGMTFFAYNGVWYYKFSASYPNTVRPNPALMMHAIEIASERGLTEVDLGRSDADQPGLLSFKEQFDPQSRELFTLVWQPPGWTDERGAAVGSTLGELTKILTAPEIPEDAAARAGDLLYRYFT